MENNKGQVTLLLVHAYYSVEQFVWLRILQTSSSKIQQFYLMRVNTLPQPIFHKDNAPCKQKKTILSQRQRNFEISPACSSETYNALEDKFAFGYFQNRSVQRHLKKLLKNAKLLPPSAETRRVITSLSQKIIRLRPTFQSAGQERAKTIQSNQSRRLLRVTAENRQDMYYPYKEELKLKSLQKVEKHIEIKQRLLGQAQEKSHYFPRIKSKCEDSFHEKTMQKLIQLQERKLACKLAIVSQLNHRQLISQFSTRAKALSSLDSLKS